MRRLRRLVSLQEVGNVEVIVYLHFTGHAGFSHELIPARDCDRHRQMRLDVTRSIDHHVTELADRVAGEANGVA